MSSMSKSSPRAVGKPRISSDWNSFPNMRSRGLTNRHHTYGLGVPLIAVWRKSQGQDSAEQYCPPGLSFAVTAFLRVRDLPQEMRGRDDKIRQCVLELHDTVTLKDIEVCGRRVPLETDLTTPLAYFLRQPRFQATRGRGNEGVVYAGKTSVPDGAVHARTV